jgi:hypothetical protein
MCDVKNWGEAAFVLVGEGFVPVRLGKHVLDHEGVDQDESGLKQVKR